MVKYSYQGENFVVNDFQNAKTFASFLPAIAGIDGKPLWAFYANVGQVMGGFGVNSKETPITPFDSATLAYQNIPTKSFRSFVKVDNKVYTPFLRRAESQTMVTSLTDVTIVETNDTFEYKINYTTVPHRNYAGLVRKVTIKNFSSKEKEFEILDGLPVFFPNGLSNFCYKELVSLMAAYCEVEKLDQLTPFVKFKTSTSDNAIVEEAVSGNGYFTIDQNNQKLLPIVDLALVFQNDKSLFSAQGFEAMNYEEFIKKEQQIENKLPCAFSLIKKSLKPNEEYSFISLYGMFDTIEIYQDAIEKESYQTLDQVGNENAVLIDELLKPCETKTSNKMFDRYMKQSFLDNNLRGGFPCQLSKSKEVYYVYGRKHGDMERDYNSFQIPSRYYSSGCGNFRDVNQNRRNDLYFYPFVEDYNIKLFFNLIQADGQNPLNVRPLKFICTDNFEDTTLNQIKHPLKNKVRSIISGSFEPSELYLVLKDNQKDLNGDVDDIFTGIINQCHQIIKANFAEGYWIDHWTYNVDLLENYRSVYPDKLEGLLFDNSYSYFYSKIYVEPRDEKYCLLPNGMIRQYGAIDLGKAKKECEKTGKSLAKTFWLENRDGQKVHTTLANKIFALIVIKFSTLDSRQLGIEMECEKPGWNDAMNGLPGLFASGMSETIELLRLVRFARSSLGQYIDRKITMFDEQYEFYSQINQLVRKYQANQLSKMEYWDQATKAREVFRKSIKEQVSTHEQSLKIKDMMETLDIFEEVLTKGIKEAKQIGDGILPSYLIYEVTSYEKTGKTNHLGYETVKAKEFNLELIPPFLEASARAMKLGKEIVKEEDYLKIKNSDLYDQKLGFYKTCASLDSAPFEIGRVHAFTKGWLERECNFLHMNYKYLLGLLKAELYEEFKEETAKNFTFNMDPNIYGRNPIENSSFIVPSCNPDKSLHGQGFFARLTGANAEVLNIFALLFIGENIFTYKDGILKFNLNPKLPKEYFDSNDEASFSLFGKTKVVYHNPQHLDLYQGVKLIYRIGKEKYDEIKGDLALKIRECTIDRIDVDIKETN